MPILETYEGVKLWYYVPSLPLSVIFTALFTLAAVAHTWKMVRAKLWFCLPFVVGVAFEVIGYISRAAAWSNTGSLIPYIIQAIFIVIAPVLFAASLYMVYSRVVRAVHGEHCSIMSPRWSTRIFVLGDVICLNIQSSGSGLLSNTDASVVQIGEYIIIGGLALQILVFIVFMWCCINFHRRFLKTVAETDAVDHVPWRSCLNMLYMTSLAILVRNVYRVAEFVTGQSGYIFSHEWPTYVFDGALMLIVALVFYIWHPSDLQINKGGSMIELINHGADTEAAKIMVAQT